MLGTRLHNIASTPERRRETKQSRTTFIGDRVTDRLQMAFETISISFPAVILHLLHTADTIKMLDSAVTVTDVQTKANKIERGNGISDMKYLGNIC